MYNIAEAQAVENMKQQGALFILFGGQHCNVCQSVRQPLASLVDERFPEMQAIYVDCTKSPDICAQHGVFSVPAVKVFIEGMLVVEDARAFSLPGLMQKIARPYEAWISAKHGG